MKAVLKIGIIGDYDGRPSHTATNDAIQHAAASFEEDFVVDWIPTETLLDGTAHRLSCYDGIWCAPGSPYKSMHGALNGIQYTREMDIPYIGTCGGFQHAALELARDVLKIEEIQASDYDLYAPNLFISALSCSLVGQSRHIFIDKSSSLYQIYGASEVEERYNCNFSIDKYFLKQLEQSGVKVVAVDEEGDARAITLKDKKFFLATLFQPQLSSTSEHPHPLIIAFLTSVRDIIILGK